MKLFVWEVFNGYSFFFFFMNPLRKEIQNIQNICSMSRFRPGMTSIKVIEK